MSDTGKTSGASDARDALPPASTSDPLTGPRAELAKVIPRRPRVSWWLGIVLAAAFALLVIPSVTAERWLGVISSIERGKEASFTVRVPPFAGVDSAVGHTGGGGVLIKRGDVPDRDTVELAQQIDASLPHGPVPYLAYLLLVGVLAGLFTHHTRRSVQGRLLRVQLVSLALIIVAAIAVKVVMLTTALSVLVVPVALFAMVPTLVLDRIVGLATGTLAALVVSLLVPFDVGVAVMLMVQAGAAGLVIAERPKKRFRAVLTAGAAATLFTAATYPLMLYLTAGRLPLDELQDPLHSAWIASAIGPALATVLAALLVPAYQLLVGEITQSKLVELEDLSHPLLKQIANKAPGTWQHSLMMANMAEIAANTIGANGRLVRVGAYYHDLGKSLQAKYFIENLEPGETSPHDKLPPEVSCDAIFAHVTEGIVAARRAGLHERIIDFMHMHHGNGVLEYFWGKTREQGNPKGLSVEHFRYPGVPPQSRETAILSICDAVEAASRTLKKPEVQAIDNLVQRIVYGKLHLGQLDESGLSMGDLRRIAESLRDTIKHANHGRIEYPWQKAQQDASASANQDPGTGQLSLASALTTTGPRLDSLDRPARPDTVAAAAKRESADALAVTDSAHATPNLKAPRDSSELAMKTTAPVARPASSTAERAAQAQTWKAGATAAGMDLSKEIDIRVASDQHSLPPDDDDVATRKHPKEDLEDDVVELRSSKPKFDDAGLSAPDLPPPRPSEPIPHSSRPSEPPRNTLVGVSDSTRLPYQPTEPARPNLKDLASNAAATQPIEIDAHESDPRMRRVTNPVAQQRASAEAIQFAEEAKEALEEASKDMAALPRDAGDAGASQSQPMRDAPQSTHDAASASQSASSSQPMRDATDEVVLPEASVARKRAATLPPLRPPTVPPPIGRRSPTMPPIGALRPPTSPANMTVPPPGTLRPPATPASSSEPPGLPGMTPPPGATAPPPLSVRPPGPNLLDDMITLRPQYERVEDGLRVKTDEDGSVKIEPAKQAASTDDAVVTQPRMLVSDDDAADSYSFGRATPVSAPTRAELQALMSSPPDVTRQQSLDEIEELHRQTRDRNSEPELQLTRRAPYPTREVEDADIEAAIELAPPARRNSIGVAKKPKE